MIDKRTVFVLGAGASCPYGYPSGAHLRERICLEIQPPHYGDLVKAAGNGDTKLAGRFKQTFENSSTKSIDLFMARNPRLAPVGKCFIAFEMFTAEQRSQFREKAKRLRAVSNQAVKKWDVNEYLQTKDFQGEDWYSYLFDRLTAGFVETDVLPDFSDGKLALITFNYDRSLEHFLYESVRNSFTEVPENRVADCLKSLRILHVYGQVAPLKWQDSEAGVEYRPPISEDLIKNAAAKIKTIYEEKESAELSEAHELLKSAQRIFFLGFGYAPENMEVLNLPQLIPPRCEVCGTAFGMTERQIAAIETAVRSPRRRGQNSPVEVRPKIEDKDCDCLRLLRKHL